MTDLASLVLAVDSTQVKTGTASLDGLTAAGMRADAVVVKMGASTKGAGVAAAAMAAQAQASARAATGMATSFTASASAARLNTIAMRETLVVARELSRGNFTRIPGSLSLLAANVSGGVGGFAASIANSLGLVKKLQNAELAEQAANAAAAAQAVQGAAERASANIMAADTELALAQAQVRVAEGSAAETAAQARLAAAHEAVAAAASEAAIAEDALAVAAGRANEAAAANAAATSTVIGGAGIGLIGIGTVALVAYGAIKQFQDQVKDSGDLDTYADKLNLTDAQVKQLGGSVTYLGHNVKEVQGITVSFGDVMHGVWEEISREISNPTPWDNLASSAISSFNVILSGWNKVSAGISAGLDFFGKLSTTVFSAFHGGTAPLPGIGDLKKFYDDELKRNQIAFSGIKSSAIGHAEQRMQSLSAGNNPAKGSSGRSGAGSDKQSAIDTELEKLDAQIASQNALAQAYLATDAAVIKAEADQKAMTLAVEKHANAAQTAALKEKELALAIATGSAEGAKKVSDLKFEADARKHVNDMVAAGLIPASQANQQLALEKELRPLIALASVAEGAAKQRLLDIIKSLTAEQGRLNAATNVANAQAQIAANDNEIAQLKLKNELLGHSNEEIATALANLQTMQYLQEHPGIDASTAAQLAASNVKKATAAIQTPFQQWAATVPQTAKAVNDALQQIEFKGFDSLGQAITDVLTGTKSLTAAFGDMARSIIADIIQMTIKMLIFKAVSSIFGFSGGGGNDVTGNAKGNVFSGGNVVPFALGGVVTSPTLFPMANGMGLMGEAGPEAVMPLTRDSQGRLGVRANDNRSGPIEVVIAFGDAPQFAPYVQAVAAASGREAVKVSVKHTNDTIRAAVRPKLNGR
jgi:lambda family phage tail tape measure protein